MILRVGEADFEVEALHHRILGAVPLLSRLIVDSGEGEVVVEGAGLVEGEDLEERILEASRVTSAVGGPGIIRWARLTSRSNSGVSPKGLNTRICFLHS
jgi:hypothetical protein